jgi:putative membrane protein
MRLLLRWLVTTVAVAVATGLVPGLRAPGGATAVLVVAAVLGLLNALVRPLLVALSCGLIVVTLGLFYLVLNALLFWLAGWIAQRFGAGFVVDNLWAAFLGSIVVSLVATVFDWLVPEPRD